ncbi:hypothetical protein D0T84_09205 [Dysgonomonas sp. 521]|uniref:hypothetical protein n=1 Tax=Dysgonomonas sp. 521 TaxID=2302932 RepID=UPI0013D3F581|nr:hypothetical protein [Dysgonomonas sp. 521]NDV95095.1 hypothetical protein [Dysgonomonas sp. 521]
MCSFIFYSARNHRLLALLLAEAPKVSKKALRPASPYDPPSACRLNEVIMDSSFYRLADDA